MSPRGTLVLVPSAGLVSTLVFAGSAVVVQTRLGAESRLIPLGEHLISAVEAVPTLVFFALLAVVGRRAMAGRSPRFRLAYLSGVVVVQVLATGLMLVAIAVSGPNFLGASRIEDCSCSPDGKVRACLYSGGLMCGYEIWAGQKQDWVLTRRSSISKTCSNMEHGAKVGWRNDGSPQAVGSGGIAIVDDTTLFLVMPH